MLFFLLIYFFLDIHTWGNSFQVFKTMLTIYYEAFCENSEQPMTDVL